VKHRESMATVDVVLHEIFLHHGTELFSRAANEAWFIPFFAYLAHRLTRRPDKYRDRETLLELCISPQFQQPQRIIKYLFSLYDSINIRCGLSRRHVITISVQSDVTSKNPGLRISSPPNRRLKM
jgi:hypothetical protein